MNAVDPSNRFGAAKLLIDQHGADAKAHVMQRVIELRRSGDEAGNEAWMGVMAAILDLESKRPADGEALH